MNVIEYYVLRKYRTHNYHTFKTSSPLDVLSHFFYFLKNFKVAYLDPKMSNNSVIKLKENIMNGTSMKLSWEGIALSICFYKWHKPPANCWATLWGSSSQSTKLVEAAGGSLILFYCLCVLLLCYAEL